MNFFVKLFFHILIIILSASWILLYCPGYFEINKIPETLTTSAQCPEILTGIDSPEDMVRYKNVLLISSRNLIGLSQGKHEEIQDGSIYAYYPQIESSNQQNNLQKVMINYFPKGKKFFPFGMKLFNENLLYVINQSSREKEGELIEVFQIVEIMKGKIQLQYLRTIYLPNYLVGKINNLAVLSENEIFVSQYKYSKFALINMIIQIFNIKICGIYYCKTETNETQCYKQDDLNSITAFNNGLWIDRPNNNLNKLFVSLTMEKTIGIFIIHKNSNPNQKITYQHSVSIDGYPDNIYYDKEYDTYYIGTILKPFELSTLLDGSQNDLKIKDDARAWGGVSIIKNGFYVNNLKAETIVQLNDLIRTISVAVRIDKKLYLGSAFDNRILVCNIDQLFEQE